MRRLLGSVVMVLLGLAGRAHALCVDGTVVSCTLNGQAGTKECVDGYWTPCDVPNPPPPPPTAPVMVSRTAGNIRVRWNGPTVSGQSYQLQHWTGATWAGLTSVVAGSTFVHSGLAPDSKHCYRVRSTPSGLNSGYNCAYTSDGTGRQVWRIQLEVHTASVGDAGTDDSVNVALNEYSIGPGSNLTWMDYGRDDREGGDTFRYDLNLDDIALFSDINKIQLNKVGTDGWCIADFRLLVNERAVYSESFSALPGGCLWLDGNDGHVNTYTVDHTKLRAHPLWQGYVEPFRVSFDPFQNVATLTIPRAETESRIEGMIGHLIHGTQAHWGDKHGRAYVEADPSGVNDRLKLDLDLEASVDYWFDPELDIDFDLHYTAGCSTDQTRALAGVTTENLEAHVDFDWFSEFLSGLFILECEVGVGGDCISKLEHFIEDRIEASFTPISQSQSQVLPLGYRCLSAEVAVDANANVSLIYHVQPPTAFR